MATPSPYYSHDLLRGLPGVEVLEILTEINSRSGRISAVQCQPESPSRFSGFHPWQMENHAAVGDCHSMTTVLIGRAAWIRKGFAGCKSCQTVTSAQRKRR